MSRGTASARRLFSRLQPQAQQRMRPSNDLLCRSGCGFYGNPEWQWYCSKCWRQQQQVQTQREVPPARARSPIEGLSSPSPKKENFLRRSASAASAKSAEKSLKSKFMKRDARPSPTEPRAKELLVPPEAKPFQNELVSFLQQRINNQAVVDVSRQLKVFIDKVTTEVDTISIDDLSNFAQDYYQSLRKRLNSVELYSGESVMLQCTHFHVCYRHLFSGLTEVDVEKIMDLSERFVMVFCFKFLFCPPSTNDEEKDLELQTRIRRLNWISTKDLGCAVNESSQDVRDSLHKAINCK